MTDSIINLIPYQKEIESILSKLNRTKVIIKKVIPLVTKAIKVYRIVSTNNLGIANSWIIKCIDPTIDILELDNKEAFSNFERERINYLFLSKIKKDFPHCPALIFAKPNEFLILEDLGQNERLIEIEEAEIKLAELLANFHYSTHINVAHFDDIKRKFPEPKSIETRKIKQFALGISELKNLANHFSIFLSPQFYHEIQQVQSLVEKPGVFWALTHNDLVSPRQCILKNERFHLLDFERSSFLNCLLDLAKIELGKFEHFKTKERLDLSVPGFSDKFKTHYKQTLCLLGYPNFSESSWNQSFHAALVYHTITQISRLVTYMNNGLAMKHTFLFYLKYFLKEILKKLEPNNEYPAIAAFFSTLNSYD